MRQLVAFLETIRIRSTKKEYYRMSFFAKLHKAEIASLDTILGVASEDEAPQFTEEEDKAMEDRALALLEERKKAASVRRSINKN